MSGEDLIDLTYDLSYFWRGNRPPETFQALPFSRLFLECAQANRIAKAMNPDG